MNDPGTVQNDPTPAMIAAGIQVLDGAYLGDGRYALTDRVLMDLYRAMAAASRPESAGPDP
jgi:hypothetical protein